MESASTLLRRRHLRRLGAGLLAAAPGLAAAEASKEFWPELQVFWRFSPTMRVLFNPAPTRSRDSDDRTADDWGLYLDYRVPKDPISYRIGYVYSVSNPLNRSTRTTEDRFVLDFNYRWKFGDAWQLIDRTRLDLRDKEGRTSQRLRNRVQLEYETRLGEYGLVPYANLEAYYDTRYDTIARWKVELGATLVFSPQADLTPYYGRQTDTQPVRSDINALGLMLALHF